MICKKPFRVGVMEYGCGQCMFCRVNKCREWVGRLLLERMEHRDACFVTLTIADEHLKGPDLNKRSLQLFLKRLRFKVGPLRYFAVGEYGDVNWRPHYHAVLFGVSPTQEEVIRKCWPYGFVQCGTADVGAMNYVTGYVLKKMTRPSSILNGRVPEFALQSRHPGLGHGVVKRIHLSVTVANLQNSVPILKDIRVFGKKYPIGRYLREKAYKQCGVSEDARAIARVQATIEVDQRKSIYPTIRAYEVQRAARVQQQSTIRKVRTL